MKRADDRDPVGHLRHLRQLLGDRHALGLGRDRLEVAADGVGGLGLEVPHVDRRRPAGQPDENHGVGLATLAVRLPGAGLQAEEVRQAQAEQPGRADLEEVATVEALAVGPCPEAHQYRSFPSGESRDVRSGRPRSMV